jgi:DNA-binding beta-propeller fold protein YncE
VSRLALDGTTQATAAGFEPFGIAIDPGSDAVWVTDLTNGRLLLFDRDGVLRRRGPPLDVPYGVIAHLR